MESHWLGLSLEIWLDLKIIMERIKLYNIEYNIS